jgi:putative aldouronate transport system permease protein
MSVVVAKNTPREVAFRVFLTAVMLTICVATLYPFLNVLALSLNESLDTVRGGIHIWPRSFTVENYRRIFATPLLLVAFRNSVLRTVIGMFFTVLSCSAIAYTLSRREFMFRRSFGFMFALTMYVQGGLIPTYLLIRSLGLFNSFAVYILPALVGAWNMFVIRSYMSNLPDSLVESARIDGANDLVIFAKIIMPLSLPVLATMALFVAVFQWNQWFDVYLYNSSSSNLTTLQYELRKILEYTNVQFSAGTDLSEIERLGRQASMVSPRSLRMAMTMVATVPILLVYPFLQRYFVSGLTLGAVKS